MIRVYSGYNEPPVESLLSDGQLKAPKNYWGGWGSTAAKIDIDGDEYRRFARWWPSMCPIRSDSILIYGNEALKVIGTLHDNWNHFKLLTETSVLE
jgi:hypothetical protein